jgi:hypothetical protein
MNPTPPIANAVASRVSEYGADLLGEKRHYACASCGSIGKLHFDSADDCVMIGMDYSVRSARTGKWPFSRLAMRN